MFDEGDLFWKREMQFYKDNEEDICNQFHGCVIAIKDREIIAGNETEWMVHKDAAKVLGLYSRYAVLIVPPNDYDRIHKVSYSSYWPLPTYLVNPTLVTMVYHESHGGNSEIYHLQNEDNLHVGSFFIERFSERIGFGRCWAERGNHSVIAVPREFQDEGFKKPAELDRWDWEMILFRDAALYMLSLLNMTLAEEDVI